MSDRYDRRVRQRPGPSNRTALGYWVPLILTVTAASLAVGAWIWSERRDGEDDGEHYGSRRRGKAKRRATTSPPHTRRHGDAVYGQGVEMQDAEQEQGELHDEEYVKRDEERDGDSYREESKEEEVEEEGLMSRMSGAIRRTPSPQQMFDSVRKGAVAAGAAVGRGLSAIREEQSPLPRDDFADHEKWSEEAEQRDKEEGDGMADEVRAKVEEAAGMEALVPSRKLKGKGRLAQTQESGRGKTKMVCVVVSADHGGHGQEDADDAVYQVEHASILSHLPSSINSSTTQLLVLIYAPHLQVHPLSSANRVEDGPKKSGVPSMTSSYSNISTTEADPTTSACWNPPNALYAALQNRALKLTVSPTHILPFTTRTGHIHMLRHLSPSLVYIQESLCGSQGEGEYVSQIEGWVGQLVVLVGLGGMGGGLVDTETEDESRGGVGDKEGAEKPKWWHNEDRVGLGKGIEIVEVVRLGEDWAKRAGE